jgi:hypothetical protein
MDAPLPRDLTRRPDPLPGLSPLRRRLADRPDFRDALLAGVAEVVDPGGGTVGRRLDVAGDPTVVSVAELWSRVADSVAAYTELAAGERYLGTAQDWTDLRRTTDLLGYRPTQRAAAHGWIRCVTDSGASPLVPAGTRVQAPGTPQRPAQTFEVESDTRLRADWAGLTVTAVPNPVPPVGSALRLLRDPGLAAGDRLALVAEQPPSTVSVPVTWRDYLVWIVLLQSLFSTDNRLRAVVGVTRVGDDLGAHLVTTDRTLSTVLAAQSGTTYAAYRVRATLALAHRLEKVSYVDTGGTAHTTPADYTGDPDPVGPDWILVADASAASVGMGVLAANRNGAFLTRVADVTIVDWQVAPGTRHQVGRLGLADSLPLGLRTTDLTVLLVDERQVAQHYDLPPLAPGGSRLRVHPRPQQVPDRIAVRTTSGWELAACSRDAGDADDDDGGMLLALGTPFTGTADAAPATANLVPVRHGRTTTTALAPDGGSVVVAGPVTGDVDPAGRVTDSLSVRVDGLAYDEVAGLYGHGPADPVFTTRLAADGRLVVRFGPEAAARGSVTATWRVGGGLVGELDASEITTMLGSVPGVRSVAGVGRTTGAADQEDPLRLRRGAAARIRALDRAVSAGDLADLALTVPGTSHAVAYRGAGPAGCPCGRVGLHLASLRFSSDGARAPYAAELTSLSGYLDARRDVSVALCVCAGVVSQLDVTLSLVTDPRREVATVRAAVTSALLDPAGPLAPLPRDLGLPLDASDVLAVAQPVTGVVGIQGLGLSHGVVAPSAADASIGRVPAQRYELLAVADVVAS